MCREFSTHSLSIESAIVHWRRNKMRRWILTSCSLGAIAASPNHIDHSSHRKGINFVSSRRIWINFFISSTFSHHWICSWNLAVPQPLMSFWNLSTRPLSMPKIILVRDFHTPTHFAIIRSRNVDDSEEDLTCYNSDCDYDFPVNRRGLGLERSAVITPERAACIPQPEVRKQWPRQKSTYHANARRHSQTQSSN